MRKNLFAVFLIILVLLSISLSQAQASTLSQEYAKANKLFGEGKYADALLLYRSALASPSPNIAPNIIYTRIGDSQFQLGDYRNALDAYRAALNDQKRSERPTTQYWIGFCLLMLGRDAEAVAEFMKIPELYPFSGMWVGTAYYWAGRASERMGKKEQAAGYYRKAAGNGKSAQGRFAMKKAEKAKAGSGVQ
jgi:tetratricopeptide (TPR) repeat protein